MLGASDICLQIHSRLSSVEMRLSATSNITQRVAMEDHKKLVELFHVFLSKYTKKRTVLHLVSSEHIVETCRRIHLEIDGFRSKYRLASDSCIDEQRESRFHDEVEKYKLHIKESIQKNQGALFEEQSEPETQQEALMLLLFESENRESKYTQEETDLMHQIFRHIASFPN